MCTTNCGRELSLVVYVVGQVELTVTNSHALCPCHQRAPYNVIDDWLALPVNFECSRRQRVYLGHAATMEHPASRCNRSLSRASPHC